MKITRQFIRIFVIVCGILVLLSYVYGVSRAEDGMALWGGIPESWIKFIVPCRQTQPAMANATVQLLIYPLYTG